MKNLIKCFRVIAILAIIGFILTGCSEKKEPTIMLEIVNQNDETITWVELEGAISYPGGGMPPLRTYQSFNELNITKGESQTFTISYSDDTKYSKILIRYGENNATVGISNPLPSQTITKTLTTDGKIE